MNYDTQLCLISAQATPNLIAALDEQWRPRRIVLATSTEMRENAKYLENVLKKRGIIVERLPIGDAYDYFSLYETFFNFLERQTVGIALNITGGTKIMAMAAQEAFRDSAKPVFYVNVKSDTVFQFGEGKLSATLSGKLGLADFLEVHGYKFETGTRPLKPVITRDESDLTLRIVDGVELFGQALGELNLMAAQAKGSLQSKLDERQRDSINLQKLLDLFVEGRHLTRLGDAIRFSSEDSRIFVGGGWLEQHVAKAISDCAGTKKFTDYGSNIKIVAPNGTTLNEIDAAFLYQNPLHLIECKAANLGNTGHSGDDKGTEAIYKLETLLKMGGLRTRGMLIDYRGRLSVVRNEADRNRVEANLARAKAANIRIVSGSAIKTLKSEITQWIA